MYEWIADTVSKTFAAGRLNDLEDEGWEIFSAQWIKEKDGHDLTLCYMARRKRKREQDAGEQVSDDDHRAIKAGSPRWTR
jgi:hypothetical protein